MKPWLSIVVLFLGMAATLAASPFTFAPLPPDPDAGTSASVPVHTNTPPLTNLVVVDQVIQNLPAPTNLPPTAAPVQAAPKPTPGQAIDWSDEPNLPQLKPSPHAAPVRIDNAPIENNTVTTNSLPSDSLPVIQNSQPAQIVTPPPVSAPVAPVAAVPPSAPVISEPTAAPVVQARANVAPPAVVAKAKPVKHDEFVFAPLPVVADEHPNLVVHYEAVKDVIPPPTPMPARVPEPAAASPVVKKSPAPVKGGTRLIVSASHEVYGTVAAVDPHGRFAVLNFPLGRMPAPGDVLPVFRHGVNVGQVKVTGPQRDDNTAADVLSGDLQADDDVRD